MRSRCCRRADYDGAVASGLVLALSVGEVVFEVSGGIIVLSSALKEDLPHLVRSIFRRGGAVILGAGEVNGRSTISARGERHRTLDATLPLDERVAALERAYGDLRDDLSIEISALDRELRDVIRQGDDDVRRELDRVAEGLAALRDERSEQLRIDRRLAYWGAALVGIGAFLGAGANIAG